MSFILIGKSEPAIISSEDFLYNTLFGKDPCFF